VYRILLVSPPWFLEDNKGQIIDMERATVIHDCAHGFFNAVEEKFLLRSWEKANIDLQAGLSSLMQSRFPEFPSENRGDLGKTR